MAMRRDDLHEDGMGRNHTTSDNEVILVEKTQETARSLKYCCSRAVVWECKALLNLRRDHWSSEARDRQFFIELCIFFPCFFRRCATRGLLICFSKVLSLSRHGYASARN